MPSREEISHTGRVESITPDTITVGIVSESACSSCHAASLCGMSELKKKSVCVPATLADDYSVGEEVEVVLKASMGHKAVWIGYCIPLVVLLAGLLGAFAAGLSELVSGLVGLVAVAAYYFVIWLMRDKLRNVYDFCIRKIK